MAYLSFEPWHAQGAATQIASPMDLNIGATASPMDLNIGASSTPADVMAGATASDVARFSGVELRVIDLAKRIDATREIAPQGRLGRFLGSAFGFRFGGPLADRRLETLRRFASKVRHHSDEVADADLQSLVEAGYSSGQAHGLLAYLSTRQRAA
jgi:hypothetical protein